jgi:ABC-type dipeptide/oligopeptide/nickel transport system permease subunit
MINWTLFFKQRQNLLAIFLVVIFVVVALAAPWLSPADDPENPQPFKITDQSFTRLPVEPSEDNILGTVPQIRSLPQFGIGPDQDGHYHWDVLHTLIWGTRSALRFGLVVSLTAGFLGVMVGSIGAYLGGRTDRLLLFMTDSFLAFPVIAVAWLIQRTWFASIFNPFLEIERAARRRPTIRLTPQAARRTADPSGRERDVPAGIPVRLGVAPVRC